MELVNGYAELVQTRAARRRALRAAIADALETTLVLLAPFVPHIANELWERLGRDGVVDDVPWPDVDETALVEDEVEMVVQVNGKVRGRFTIAAARVRGRGAGARARRRARAGAARRTNRSGRRSSSPAAW